MDESIRDEKVKAAQKRARQMIREGFPRDATEIERAIAMTMEGDAFLRRHGIMMKFEPIAGNA